MKNHVGGNHNSWLWATLPQLISIYTIEMKNSILWFIKTYLFMVQIYQKICFDWILLYQKLSVDRLFSRVK